MVLPETVQQLVVSDYDLMHKTELVQATKSLVHNLLQTFHDPITNIAAEHNDKPWTWMTIMLVFVAAFLGVYMQHQLHVEQGNRQHLNFVTANFCSMVMVWAFGITTVLKINDNMYSSIGPCTDMENTDDPAAGIPENAYCGQNYAWKGTAQQDCAILAFGVLTFSFLKLSLDNFQR